jgi:hypothetical protein
MTRGVAIQSGKLSGRARRAIASLYEFRCSSGVPPIITTLKVSLYHRLKLARSRNRCHDYGLNISVRNQLAIAMRGDYVRQRGQLIALSVYCDNQNSNLAAESSSLSTSRRVRPQTRDRFVHHRVSVMFRRMQQNQYTESVALQDPLTDSDGDDSRPEDRDRQQYMFIWNQTYEVATMYVLCAFVCVEL